MGDAEPQFLDVEGRKIAVISEQGTQGADGLPGSAGTGLFWLPGFKSDMASTKVLALAEFARGRYGMTRFDYSGHGLSGGAFEDGTIGQWLDEAEAVFRAETRGPQVVVGSSMGGYIALLLLRRLLAEVPGEAARIKALVLIAPAWDMTEALMWRQFTAEQRAHLMDEGYYLRPSEYGEPYKITRTLIEEGRAHLLTGKPFDPGRPVHVLQGLLDDAVPAEHSRELAEILTGGHLTIEEVADGDHRLSRAQDVERLKVVVKGLA